MMAKPRLNWTAEPWDDSEPLECTMIVPEAPGCATITFRAPSGAWFDYQPGQFLTLDLSAAAVQRTYTISSSPSRPLSISITVKAQDGSIGTRWMLDHLRPGMRLKAYGPSGAFSLLRHPAAEYQVISAGGGLPPKVCVAPGAGGCDDVDDHMGLGFGAYARHRLRACRPHARRNHLSPYA